MVARLWPADAVGGAPSYTGRALRQTLSPLLAGATSGRPLGALSGIRPGIGIFVGVSSTVWYANAFSGVIDTEAAAISGPYAFAFDAQTSGAMTAAGGTARIDALAVRLNDGAEGDGTLVAPFVDIVYSVGTASPPAVPARSFVIAYLNVPATGGGVPTVTQVAPYTVAAGGILPASSSSASATLGGYPSSPSVGQYVDDASLGTLMRYGGSNWRPVNATYPIIPASVGPAGVVASPTGKLSFSSTSGVNINSIFPTNVDKFDVLIDISGMSTPGHILMYLRAGSDIGTANYDWVQSYGSGTTAASSAASAANWWQLTAGVSGSHSIRMTIFTPNQTALKRAVGQSVDYTGAAAPVVGNGAYGFRLTTPCDGFSIYPLSGGTFSGSISVEGHIN